MDWDNIMLFPDDIKCPLQVHGLEFKAKSAILCFSPAMFSYMDIGVGRSY